MELDFKQLKGVFSAVEDSIIIFSENGDYLKTFVNSDKSCGVDSSELDGKNIYEVFDPSLADSFLQKIQDVISEKQVNTYEYSISSDFLSSDEKIIDGSLKWFRANIAPVFEDDGSVKSVVWITKNITDSRNMEERLKELSMTDPNTGIYNRRFFFSELNNFFHRFLRGSKSYSIIMISLDRYEKFSETYGNESGGEIVSGFVDIIKDFLRLTDIFACIGGEDFVILLPDTDSKGVKHVADRLREYIEKSTFRVADIDVNITASFGCSEVSKFDTSYDNVVNRSEIALYQAKHFGGNKVSLLDYKSWKK